jgi:hypothetical protein
LLNQGFEFGFDLEQSLRPAKILGISGKIRIISSKNIIKVKQI